MISRLLFYTLFFLTVCLPQIGEALLLKDRLQKAETGDYLVTAIDTNYTVLIIREKEAEKVVLEEVTIPGGRLQTARPQWSGWKTWVQSNAPGHTSWMRYTIEPNSGNLKEIYSYSRQGWCRNSEADQFLPTLLKLHMGKIPRHEMKKVGPPPPEPVRDTRRTWSPRLIFEGKEIPNVKFEAWRTRWPNDRSDLSGKVILVYLPEENPTYPSYFPYWLEVHGAIGKAKLRIIDSGRDLQSPMTSPAIYQ